MTKTISIKLQKIEQGVFKGWGWGGAGLTFGKNCNFLLGRSPHTPLIMNDAMLLEKLQQRKKRKQPNATIIARQSKLMVLWLEYFRFDKRRLLK